MERFKELDFEKELAYCEQCGRHTIVEFIPAESDHWGNGTAHGTWVCFKCDSDNIGTLRQCELCGGEFVSHEGERLCEVCMDKGGIA